MSKLKTVKEWLEPEPIKWKEAFIDWVINEKIIFCQKTYKKQYVLWTTPKFIDENTIQFTLISLEGKDRVEYKLSLIGFANIYELETGYKATYD